MLIFVSGKGGTGKSAIAAATAIDFARRGHSVLTIDMASATGLATHLRAQELTYQPMEVRPGLFAMTMNRSDALDEYLKTQLHVPRNLPTHQITAALAVLADTAPGVREILSIGKPIAEARSGEWDVVIVDCPPLGQFQSYLSAPLTIAELVPKGNMRRLATRMREILLDEDQTRIDLVTAPAELPVIETQEAIDTIKQQQLAPAPTVVVNGVITTSGLTMADLAHIPQGPLSEAANMQLSLEKEQAAWRDAIAHRATLPYLFGVLTPGEVAEQLADELGGRT